MIEIVTVIVGIAAIFSAFGTVYLLVQNSKFRNNDKSDTLCSKHNEKTVEMEIKINKQETEIELLKAGKASSNDVVKIFEILEHLTGLVKEIRDKVFK
jgi:predicted ATPase